MRLNQNKKHAILFFVTFIFTASISFSQEYSSFESMSDYIDSKCKNAKTTLDGNDCLNEAFSSLDKEFNRVYKKIIHSFDTTDQNSKKVKSILIASQKAWLKYFEVYPNVVYQEFIEGSARNSRCLDAKITLMINRMNELKRAYLFLFNKEIQPDNLLGKWKKLTCDSSAVGYYYHKDDGTSIYEFVKSDSGYVLNMYDNNNQKVKKLMYDVKDGFLKAAYSKSNDMIADQWIYIECLYNSNLSPQRNDVLMYFLQGEGEASDTFVKQKK